MKQPGEFKKQQSKHKKIQHNRDQIKLLKEEKITEAELFVLTSGGLSKVTVIKPGLEKTWFDCVWYRHRGKLKGLCVGTVTNKDGLKVDGTFVQPDDIIGEIIKVECLKK